MVHLVETHILLTRPASPLGERRLPLALRALLLLVLGILSCPGHGQGAGQWGIEVIDGGNGRDVGKFSSLAIDRFGNLQVAYYDSTNHSLWYAYRSRSNKRWYGMQIDPDAGTYASLAVDARGYPHIASNSWAETGLHYDFWDGKTWHHMIIDRDRTDHYLSLQLDAAGYPHISYYREYLTGGGFQYALYLKYAYFDGKTWYLQTVDRHFGSGKSNSIALSQKGHPWIALSEVGSGNLEVAHWRGSKWTFETADARSTNGNSYVGLENSIALDKHGYPHITYLDSTKARIKYAWEDKNGWHREVVDQLGGLESDFDHTSLQLDKEGWPHVAYYDAGLGALKYAYKDATGWHVEVVDNAGNVGEYPSLALDAHGMPYISYYDVTNRALKVAHLESTNVSRVKERP
jgi:hypothetical protein